MRLTRDKKPGFDSEYIGCYLKIKLRGEIDHHCASAIRKAMDNEIFSKRPRGLIIDMSGVDFMDSSGLGLIMGRYSVMKELSGEVIVQNPSEGTERIMRLAGMERLIKIEHTAKVDACATRVKKSRGTSAAQCKKEGELK